MHHKNKMVQWRFKNYLKKKRGGGDPIVRFSARLGNVTSK